MNNAKRSQIQISVVVPMYNEEENVTSVVAQILSVLDTLDEAVEVVLVDDGSVDQTRQVAQQLAEHDERVRVVSYLPNAGRGRALRVGFVHARGEIVVSIDADLSYEPSYILDLVRALDDDSQVDFVMGSPYMPGGGTENVPLFRLLVSRVGNNILRMMVNKEIYTFTGIFRAYRRYVLEALELESDSKEIHLEILSRALAAGYRVKEVPAVLRGRQKGRSKFRFGGTAISHLIFSFVERPMVLFGIGGAALLAIGLVMGIYVSVLRFEGTLNPGRPLITMVAILMLGGLQIISFGFIATQIGSLRREIVKVQRENRLLARDIKRLLNGEPTSEGQE